MFLLLGEMLVFGKCGMPFGRTCIATNVSAITGYFVLVLMYDCFLTSEVLFRNYLGMFDVLHSSTSTVLIAPLGGF